MCRQEVADSPYALVVSPGDAYGPRSEAYGTGVTTAVATLDNTFYVQARCTVTSDETRGCASDQGLSCWVEKNQHLDSSDGVQRVITCKPQPCHRYPVVVNLSFYHDYPALPQHITFHVTAYSPRKKGWRCRATYNAHPRLCGIFTTVCVKIRNEDSTSEFLSVSVQRRQRIVGETICGRQISTSLPNYISLSTLLWKTALVKTARQ